MITIKQQGESRHSYLFDKSSGRAGGPLHGANFFADICTSGSTSRDSTRCTQVDENTWEIASIDTDPDFVLYLWKKSRGEQFDFYIHETELLFLYQFFLQNNFTMMLDDVQNAFNRLEKKNQYCVLI